MFFFSKIISSLHVTYWLLYVWCTIHANNSHLNELLNKNLRKKKSFNYFLLKHSEQKSTQEAGRTLPPRNVKGQKIQNFIQHIKKWLYEKYTPLRIDATPLLLKSLMCTSLVLTQLSVPTLKLITISKNISKPWNGALAATNRWHFEWPRV